MRFLLLLSLLSLTACASWQQTPAFDGMAAPDSLRTDRPLAEVQNDGLLAARWHLLRALEAGRVERFAQAQTDLDLAFRILADSEQGEVPAEDLEALGEAVEKAYLELLPHLESFSPDSPLCLLLEGLSEEKIENLPPDATQLVRIHQLSQRCDMPIDANAKVAASIHFFQTRGRTTFSTWTRRSGRFRELILDILRQEKVPEDLLFIAMIESGFNPRAYSRARAVGLWQFMAHTGRLQGLRRSHWVDERRDPLKSTRAAARHLKALYRDFADWRLAIAAYNAGHGRVSRAIARAASRDFWKLDLPRETENYVPLFMAATIISKDPALFGFEEIALDPSFRFDAVTLPDSLPYVDLKAAAKSIGVSYTTLRELNPELRQRITPPQGNRSRYRLRLPEGKGKIFLQRYASLPQTDRPALYKYEVQPRDNLSTIAHAFGVGGRLIVEANSIRDPNRIYPGQVLYIPATAGRGVLPAHQKQIHTVRPGEALSRIARQYGVRLRDLLQWNGISGTLIRPGDRLIVWTPKADTGGKTLQKSSIRLDARDQRQHTVQLGETLWGLARAFDVSVTNLKQWNGLQGSLIRPGQQLTVAPPPAAEDDRFYTVVKGDTLYSIARRFGLRARDLARRNNISLSTTLLMGMTLKITSQDEN